MDRTVGRIVITVVYSTSTGDRRAPAVARSAIVVYYSSPNRSEIVLVDVRGGGRPRRLYVCGIFFLTNRS